MRSVSLREVARATGGTLDGAEEASISSVFTDTRQEGGDLFIALRGERFDGHEFLERAVEMGARAAVARRGDPRLADLRRLQPGFPTVAVKDTLEAMGDLAAHVRGSAGLKVAAVTGTTGKTCTKDYLVSLLATTYRAAGSKGSYNNEVGLPLTIFTLDRDDEALVVEMGARRPGDITRLAEIALPEYGIVTNIGPGHLELFGTEESVAGAKGELAAALPASGALVLNADDPWTRGIARRSRARVVRFGTGRAGEFRAAKVSLDREGRPTFELRSAGLRETVRLPGAGRHQVPNALAAVACAVQMGVPQEKVPAALESARPGRWRMEIKRSPDGYTVINDSYNANPRSMAAALATLGEVGPPRRTVAVLGPMAELGPRSAGYHEEAGESVVENDVDLLVTVGRKARAYASAAVGCGMPRGSVFRCEDIDEAAGLLAQLLEPEDVVLVKASRAFGLERLAAAMLEPGFPGGKLVVNV